MIGGLSGATEGVIFPDKAQLVAAVNKLMTCEEHDGTHHFAVVGRGMTLYCSPVGTACWRKDEPKQPTRFNRGDEVILVEQHVAQEAGKDDGRFVIPDGASAEVRRDSGGDTVRVTVAWDRWPYIKTIDLPREKLRLATNTKENTND